MNQPQEPTKTLCIIRHAKSDQNLFVKDFDRPLNDRGKHDAPMMAQRLKLQVPQLEAFVSSPANRARSTAEFFAAAYDALPGRLMLKDDLYHATEMQFYEVIESLPQQISSAALFSHNPGITEFINSLSPRIHLDNMPTCGVFVIQIFSNEWSDFETARKKFLFFDYPKKPQ